jgi:maltose/moltooligosaccharide transporter
MVGALLASAALVLMPHSSSLWMAAGLLWVLDGSINISMEPFRAFVGDLLPPAQRETGYAMQALLIGVGASLSTALPWLLSRLGWEGAAVAGSRIPPSVHRAFVIGAVAIVACVGYTVVTTPEARGELPPEDGGGSVFGGIWRGLRAMPPVMRRLASVQFFTWLGLFCMWLYFSPAVAARYFSPVVGSDAYTRGVEWAGVCNAIYNAVCIPASYLLIALAGRGAGSRSLHRAGLICAGLGLLTTGLWASPHLLVVSMIGIGIGWAAILSMPYAQLANTIPASQMGFYMGAFNFFIVLPQIVAATLLGPLVRHAFGGRGFPMVLIGGGCMLLAALLLSWVPEKGSRTNSQPPATGG